MVDFRFFFLIQEEKLKRVKKVCVGGGVNTIIVPPQLIGEGFITKALLTLLIYFLQELTITIQIYSAMKCKRVTHARTIETM